MAIAICIAKVEAIASAIFPKLGLYGGNFDGDRNRNNFIQAQQQINNRICRKSQIYSPEH
jgi:hypothetical protein